MEFRSDEWDLAHQTLLANCTGTMFNVCGRLVPVVLLQGETLNRHKNEQLLANSISRETIQHVL